MYRFFLKQRNISLIPVLLQQINASSSAWKKQAQQAKNCWVSFLEVFLRLCPSVRHVGPSVGMPVRKECKKCAPLSTPPGRYCNTALLALMWERIYTHKIVTEPLYLNLASIFHTPSRCIMGSTLALSIYPCLGLCIGLVNDMANTTWLPWWHMVRERVEINHLGWVNDAILPSWP